jgi:hypothetical protein
VSSLAGRHQLKSRTTRFSHPRPIALSSLGAELQGSRRSPPEEVNRSRRIVAPTNRRKVWSS